MGFIKSDLTYRAQQGLRSSNYSSYNDYIQRENGKLEESGVYDIFLSHRKLDEELILGIKLKLEKEHGYKVYVDWVDDAQMSRQSIGKETAQTLRKRMRQSKSLMYAYTEKSTDSKWMPWELGFMDGDKPEKSTILPILNFQNETLDYGNQEYLNLYPPTIEEGSKLVVIEDQGKTNFRIWLNRNINKKMVKPPSGSGRYKPFPYYDPSHFIKFR